MIEYLHSRQELGRSERNHYVVWTFRNLSIMSKYKLLLFFSVADYVSDNVVEPLRSWQVSAFAQAHHLFLRLLPLTWMVAIHASIQQQSRSRANNVLTRSVFDANYVEFGRCSKITIYEAEIQRRIMWLGMLLFILIITFMLLAAAVYYIIVNYAFLFTL